MRNWKKSARFCRLCFAVLTDRKAWSVTREMRSNNLSWGKTALSSYMNRSFFPAFPQKVFRSGTLLSFVRRTESLELSLFELVGSTRGKTLMRCTFALVVVG